MFVTYKCKNCNELIKQNVNGKIDWKIKCPKCNGDANRTFSSISFDKENENVTGALQMMLYSSNPSGKNNNVI